MNLYFKVLGFIKPYWKGIVLIIVLTFSYVLFNNLSIWISVDFVRELFSPGYLQHSTAAADSSQQLSLTENLKTVTGQDQGIYQQINNKIKSFILRKDRFQTLKIVCLVIFLLS